MHKVQVPCCLLVMCEEMSSSFSIILPDVQLFKPCKVTAILFGNICIHVNEHTTCRTTENQAPPASCGFRPLVPKLVPSGKTPIDFDGAGAGP